MFQNCRNFPFAIDRMLVSPGSESGFSALEPEREATALLFL
jgi:hypothetical protein